MNIMMDLTVLYPIAAEHSAVEACGGKLISLNEDRFWFNI